MAAGSPSWPTQGRASWRLTACRAGEFAGEPAAELGGQPPLVAAEPGLLLDGLADDPFGKVDAGTEPQAQLDH